MCAGTVPVVVSGLVCSLLVLAVRDERRRMHAAFSRSPRPASEARTSQVATQNRSCFQPYHEQIAAELQPLVVSFAALMYRCAHKTVSGCAGRPGSVVLADAPAIPRKLAVSVSRSRSRPIAASSSFACGMSSGRQTSPAAAHAAPATMPPGLRAFFRRPREEGRPRFRFPSSRESRHGAPRSIVVPP